MGVLHIIVIMFHEPIVIIGGERNGPYVPDVYPTRSPGERDKESTRTVLIK